jgi:hypothetical protein
VGVWVVDFVEMYIKEWKNINKRMEEYTAVIVEPREHAALELVLKNFNKSLDERWKFLIYHGNKNKSYVERIIKKIGMSERCKLESLKVDNLELREYNLLLYSEEYYENIETEMFLVFQTDTLISERRKEVVYEYMKYDYVGAPWKNTEAVGNGGLSLRRKSKMLELLKYGKEHGFTFSCEGKERMHNEDGYYSNYMPIKEINVKKPSFEEAKRFSVESVYAKSSFGLHKPWIHMNGEEMKNLKEEFPELEELIELCR